MCIVAYNFVQEFNAAPNSSLSPHPPRVSDGRGRRWWRPGGWTGWQADSQHRQSHLSTSSRFHVHACEMRHYSAYMHFVQFFVRLALVRITHTHTRSHKVCKMEKSCRENRITAYIKNYISGIGWLCESRADNREYCERFLCVRVCVCASGRLCFSISAHVACFELENASNATGANAIRCIRPYTRNAFCAYWQRERVSVGAENERERAFTKNTKMHSCPENAILSLPRKYKMKFTTDIFVHSLFCRCSVQSFFYFFCTFVLLLARPCLRLMVRQNVALVLEIAQPKAKPNKRPVALSVGSRNLSRTRK